MELRLYPDPILVRKAKNYGSHAKTLTNEIEQMFSLMYQCKGVGLAAPQVGLPIRLAVIDTKEKRGKLVILNPKLVKVDTELLAVDEGCLSVANMNGRVVRPARCIADYTDHTGAKQRVRAEGLLARVILHELDHLDGILYTDRAEALWQVQ